jgi:hypothetical protein
MTFYITEKPLNETKRITVNSTVEAKKEMKKRHKKNPEKNFILEDALGNLIEHTFKE